MTAITLWPNAGRQLPRKWRRNKMEGNQTSKLCCAGKPLTDLELNSYMKNLSMRLVWVTAFWSPYVRVPNMTLYLSGFSRDTERTEEIYCKELAHTLLEAKKSPDLPSPSWRLRKTEGSVQSKSKGLRPGSAKGRRRLMSQLRQRERGLPSFFLCLLVLFCPLLHFTVPSHIGESKLIYRGHQFNANFIKKHPHGPTQT